MMFLFICFFFFFSSRRRHTRSLCDWSSDVCSSDLEISFLSSGYLDVSVPQLASSRPMYSGVSTTALPVVGFPIRKSRGQRLVSTSPELIAAAHVLLRLLAPRHPPCALILLIVKNSLVTAMEF